MDLAKMQALTQKMKRLKTGSDGSMSEDEAADLNGRGVEAANAKNYGIAVEFWTKSANAGNVIAMSNLSWLYQEIFGDNQEAFKWCKKAAEGGDADSMFELGIYYYCGECVEKDVALSFAWCKKAAENGVVNAMNWVGEFYRDGEGVQQNLQSAYYWFKLSAGGGNEHAQKNLEELSGKIVNSSILLVKDQKINLTSVTEEKKFVIGIGWNVNYSGRNDFDIDSVAFMLGADGKVISDDDFIFYNNLKHFSGSVEHLGDIDTHNVDDEEFIIDLTKIPSNIRKICFAICIHEAEIRNQNFGQVSDIFIRIMNVTKSKEYIRYNLSENFSYENTIVVGELLRFINEWKFQAVASGYHGGLGSLARYFGVNV